MSVVFLSKFTTKNYFYQHIYLFLSLEKDTLKFKVNGRIKFEV